MLTEHGLSLFIETASHNILFDMGQTDMFYRNAGVLGVDIKKADIAVLSHGHYDHGGGLSKFFEVNKKAPAYINKHAFLPYYNGSEKYIGLDTALKNSGRIIYTERTIEIARGITLYMAESTPVTLPPPKSNLSEMTEYGLIPDRFRHEQYLMIEEDGKRTLFCGCSHLGVVNIAEVYRPDILVGGFHYSKLPPFILETEAERLGATKTRFYTCHCTGEEQYKYLKSRLDSLSYISCGETVII